MKARYAGYCSSCRSKINVGEEIVRSEMGNYTHVSCKPVVDDTSKPPTRNLSILWNSLEHKMAKHKVALGIVNEVGFYMSGTTYDFIRKAFELGVINEDERDQLNEKYGNSRSLMD